MLDEGRIEDAMKTLDDLSDSLDAFDDLLTKDMETLHREEIQGVNRQSAN